MALSAIVQNTESFKWNILDSCKCLNKVLFTPIIIASDTEGTRASKLRYSHFISSIMTESWRYIENHYQVWREEQPCHQPIWRLETLVTWWRVQCYPPRPVSDVWRLRLSMTVNYTILVKRLLRQHLTLLKGHFFKHSFLVWCWSDGLCVTSTFPNIQIGDTAWIYLHFEEEKGILKMMPWKKCHGEYL